ncbi:Twin-arginine translocation pathway signal [Ramlibacter sp. G-1-2-2]|uniref:Twin-arginine translocation pathway signal n=1 Tax=Ramlibacter agri TaxID=2728837 RepID=A0A848H559_9BURK|nr:Bug family tripartite tricarboxylate transporter substrate binding protein [Ramlibacter agri]NML46126.1 Twin-arginine translocation pathway signal [Ramlibacter agri]
MKMTRRLLPALLLAMGAFAGSAQAADPPLRILVGFPPGGATDVVARVLAEKMQATLKQPIIVDNKPGAGGMIATQQLKAAAPDGNTVMLTIDHSQVIIPLTFKNPGYNPLTDFTPLAGVASYYNVMVLSSSIGVKTAPEFGSWLKAHPGQANYGIPAAGSVPQFAGILVGKALGTNMVAVPYKGGAPLVADLLGGQVPAGFLSLTESIEHHRAGKMQILAVSGTTRAKAAPEVPTFQELGINGIDQNPWLAFFGPKGMKPEFVAKFGAAVQAALADPEVVEKLSKLGNVPTYAPPAQLQDWVVKATNHWGAVIKESGYELQ